MTRAEFLKGSVMGLASLVLVTKFGGVTTQAGVKDSLSKTGNHIGPTPPASKSMTWTDTGNSGVMKYWNGSAWTPIRSTWDA